jgi:hypothetical protein
MTTRVVQWATGSVGAAQLQDVVDDPRQPSGHRDQDVVPVSSPVVTTSTSPRYSQSGSCPVWGEAVCG